jgi:hypothetical protein
VLVTNTYTVAANVEEKFGAAPNRFVEAYTVPI